MNEEDQVRAWLDENCTRAPTYKGARNNKTKLSVMQDAMCESRMHVAYTARYLAKFLRGMGVMVRASTGKEQYVIGYVLKEEPHSASKHPRRA